MSLRLQRQALEIFQFCAMNNVTVEIEWIPRSLNEYADSLSRVVDFDDWSVSTAFFDYIASLFFLVPLLWTGLLPIIQLSVPGFILSFGARHLKVLMLSASIGRARIIGWCLLFIL